MNFIALEKTEFEKFAKKSPYKSFMQTPEIAEYREKNGWTPYYLGVEDGGEIKAASMLVARPTFLGKSTYFAPGGPLLDLEDTTLTNFFMRHLRHYIKTHNGYNLLIDPYYELIERGRDGEPKENGFNHKKAAKNLKLNGFKEIKDGSMPKYLFTLTVKGRTPDQLFAELKRNTRNHVRKAEKAGVKIRELKREELSIFKKITESTSKRRDFQDKPLKYYEQMYDLFHDKNEIKYILAEAPDGTPLSAAMFMLYGDEIVYLFSGSEEQYMKEYNAQYLIQWHMIKYASEHKFTTYNFYGISGLPDKSDKDYGIYDFKKGFTTDETGKVVELIGTYELPISQIFYSLHSLLSKIKHRK
ncbi:peptidoglycan bridge formation glycyltransferase FemA/FemB family protein [Candidatus Saccharibacteria bacterium]|nr:peptidoglycan bridge formation glycyltransferase FemA/FemB family protein [Candidatus Saccharibacteria bacterium]